LKLKKTDSRDATRKIKTELKSATTKWWRTMSKRSRMSNRNTKRTLAWSRMRCMRRSSNYKTS